MQDIEQIYEQYMGQVYKYLFSLCHDAHLAEDLTQETFYQAIKSIHRFRGDCKLYVWLCQIGKHLWLKEQEKNKRENKIELPPDIPASAVNLDEEVMMQHEKMSLFKALHLLKDPMREVMYLRLSGEFSFKEIGEIMGKDETWARVTFYRGKQKIREVNKNEM